MTDSSLSSFPRTKIGASASSSFCVLAIGIRKDEHFDNAFPVFQQDDAHRIAFLRPHDPKRRNNTADRNIEAGRFLR